MQKYSLIAGIGNSGPAYQRTFHNAGILAVEYLSQKDRMGIAAAPWKRARGKYFRYIRGEGEFPTFAIPIGFMNESGRGIQNALTHFKITPQKMLVIHDDTDLPLGEVKITSGQGPAGHKGVASIIDALGTKEFARARIGIRHMERAGEKRMKAEEFVLKKIKRADLDILEHAFVSLAQTLLKDAPAP